MSEHCPENPDDSTHVWLEGESEMEAEDTETNNEGFEIPTFITVQVYNECHHCGSTIHVGEHGYKKVS